MLRTLYIIVVIVVFGSIGNSQVCIHDHDRLQLERQIEANRAALIKSGKLSPPPVQNRISMPAPFLEWPLRPAAGFNDFSYFYITNYVDVDPDTFKLDFNCGLRTYDGHRGTDIAIGPFSWNKVENNEVEVIAAASGVIVLKHDGEPYQECESDSSNLWNVIIIEHADGTTTWYGHMKTGMLTTKDSGDVVVVGEYLGIVASSGKSTGPHLHFEVKDSGNNVLDPFGGACNPNGFGSLWLNQPGYTDSAVNKLMTSSDKFINHPCPQLSEIFESEAYNQGDSIFFSAHWRHDLTSNTSTLTAIKPDGSISPILNLVYNRSGSTFSAQPNDVWSRKLPNDADKGKWKFKLKYDTTPNGILYYEKEFWVKETCSANKTLQGTHSVSRYYPASNSITSTANVLNGIHIFYNAENYTLLKPGFVAVQGSTLEVKTEGCN